MKCPIDNTVLLVTERNGVEIDYCPQCRGVWLDRGELDKLIEKSGSTGARHWSDSRESVERVQPRKKRRESFLGDIFDF